MKRSALAIGITVSLVLSGLSSPASGVAGFGDVASDRFFAEPIQWMVDHEITNGVSPSCFAPDDPVTRGQAAAF
ncbi:MAG: S-layer homology domain-containing protein, partial [Acidimicrobiales bacterium]